MVNREGRIIYSPSDLVCFIASPFTSWLDRFYLENPGVLEPDEETEDQKLIAETGNEHERSVLEGFKASGIGVAEVATDDREQAHADTLGALKAKAPIIYQAALEDERFAGFADFLILDNTGQYQVWDTKLAHSPKPYYAIQLCSIPKCWRLLDMRHCLRNSALFSAQMTGLNFESKTFSTTTVR